REPVVWEAARCSGSRLMAQSLPLFIALRQVPCLPTVMENHRLLNWFYLATPCMERQLSATVRAMVSFSPSTPMEQVSRTCIASRQPALTLQVSIPTSTELILLP